MPTIVTGAANVKQTIRTRFFGEMDCSPEDVITFPGGIPPFLNSTRFVIISDEKKQPLLFLQSAEIENLCFITLPIRVIDSNYQLEIDPDDLRILGWNRDRPPSIEDLSCLAILTIPETGPATANLMAPVVIDTAAQTGVQAMRTDDAYPLAYSLDGPVAAEEVAC